MRRWGGEDVVEFCFCWLLFLPILRTEKTNPIEDFSDSSSANFIWILRGNSGAWLKYDQHVACTSTML